MTGIKLHIGHGKTGTSYMQAALAISQDALLEAGYYYPLPEHSRDKAMRGETTSGNVKPDGLADFLATQ